MSFQTPITDNDQWTDEIEKVKDSVLVVDVHQAWSGPCVAVQSTLKKIVFDHGDKPLKMFTANCEKLTALADYVGPCEPKFLIIKGEEREEVTGVDAPTLRALLLSKLGVSE